MIYIKEVPSVEGFYWVKWGDYRGFVAELHLKSDGSIYIVSPIDGKTEIILSDDENYSYSSRPLEEPK